MSEQEKMSISSEGIAALGRRLDEIADHLEHKAKKSTGWGVETYGFASGMGSRALSQVLGDYEEERRALCKQLRHLRDLARDAGGCYVLTENLIDRRNRGVL